MNRERALTAVVAGAATILVAIIAATAIAGALGRSSPTSDDQARPDRARPATSSRVIHIERRRFGATERYDVTKRSRSG